METNSVLLVVLQCAYADTAARRKKLRDYRFWLKALWRSHTGRRLRQMIPAGYDVEVINASPKIGTEAGAVFEPEPLYIKRMIELLAPDVILACGKVARAGLDMLGLDYVAAPHPAWRALSNDDAAAIRAELKDKQNGY